VTRTVARLAAVCSLCMTMLALLPAAAPANTPSASIQFVNQAKLQEDGTVLVSLYYQCLPSAFGTEGLVATRLEQPSGPGEEFGPHGEAFAPANCNDQKHKITLDVAPGPFHPGSAAAQAVVFNTTGSSSAQKFAELNVR
jgi:hypothetical protein